MYFLWAPPNVPTRWVGPVPRWECRSKHIWGGNPMSYPGVFRGFYCSTLCFVRSYCSALDVISPFDGECQTKTFFSGWIAIGLACFFNKSGELLQVQVHVYVEGAVSIDTSWLQHNEMHVLDFCLHGYNIKCGTIWCLYFNNNNNVQFLYDAFSHSCSKRLDVISPNPTSITQ